MIELKTAGEIDAVAAAGDVVGAILSALAERAVPGTSTNELDAVAKEMIAEVGAVSSFLGYHPRFAPVPYPGAICASVNDAVVHTPPDARPLAAGDLLSLDFAVHLDGWCADAAFSMVVGDPEQGDPADQALIDTTERALAAGVAAAQPGARLGDVGNAIGSVVRAAGYGLLADHGGHGIGRAMHEDPHVANEGRPGRGLVLRPGLVIALEPMLIAGGGDRYTHDADGWTLRTRDGSRAAHTEHTIAITENGPRVLTTGRPSGTLAVPATTTGSA